MSAAAPVEILLFVVLSVTVGTKLFVQVHVSSLLESGALESEVFNCKLLIVDLLFESKILFFELFTLYLESLLICL